MSHFEDGSYSCTQGIELIAKVLAGKCQMKYTRVAVGKGKIPDGQSPKTMKQPADYVMDAKISSVTNPVNGECLVTVQINSLDVESGFYATGLLLYAEDPDEGEVPYTYLVLENGPEWIRPSSSIVEKLATFDLIAAVGDVENVTAIIDPQSFVTQTDLQEVAALANKAQNTADGAKTAADKAQDTADSAAMAANNAQSTAERAGAAAVLAQAAANNAQSAADNAKTAADNAQSTADNAKAAAAEAQKTADEKANSIHKHKKSDISDFPTSMTPTSHASPDTIYGIGDSSNYGHVKLSDSTNDTNGESSGIAATPAAVKKAYDLAKQALEASGESKELTEEMLHNLFGDKLPDITLANNSPATIQKVAQLGIGANFWSVGDKIGIKVSGKVEALNLNNTYYAFILGFNHNYGVEGTYSIHFQFGKTNDGKDIAFVDEGYSKYYSDNVKARFVMNTTQSSVGGWENSYMRKTVCPAFLAALPEEWKNIIRPCTKYSDNTGDNSGGQEANVTSTLDKIWLLSEYEVFGIRKYANSAEQNLQIQYDYYKNGNSSYKYRHSSTNTGCEWWLRSVYGGPSSYVFVHPTGRSEITYANSSLGFAPGFMVA